MAKKTVIDVTAAPQFYNVFRPKAPAVTVNGPAKLEIADGSLVIRDANDDIRYIFGPGTWLSVNIAPT